MRSDLSNKVTPKNKWRWVHIILDRRDRLYDPNDERMVIGILLGEGVKAELVKKLIKNEKILKFKEKVECGASYAMEFDVQPRFYERFFFNDILEVARNKADANLKFFLDKKLETLQKCNPDVLVVHDEDDFNTVNVEIYGGLIKE